MKKLFTSNFRFVNSSIFTFSVFAFLLLFNEGVFSQCTMVCNDIESVSLGSSCEAEISYDMILESPDDPEVCTPNGPDAYEVTVYGPSGNPIPTSPVVTADYMGMTLDVQVFHYASQNSCTSTIYISDHRSPDMICPGDISISCNQDSDPSVTGEPIITDCSLFAYNYVDNITQQECVDPIRTIERVWIATDDYGNSSQCVQYIYYSLPDENDIVFPPNLDDVALPVLSCENPNVDPSNTGYPTLNGAPITTGGLCNMAVSYDDTYFDGCDGSYYWVREWTIVNWCTWNILHHDQIIHVDDKVAPVVDCPDDFTAGMNNSSECSATVVFPSVSYTDNCSETVSVEIATPYGFIDGNGGAISDVPIGVFTAIYRVQDGCSNMSTCEVEVTVVDDFAPVMICDEITDISLSSSGEAVVPAEVFDDGSYDNCCFDHFEASTDGINFAETVIFDCDDVPTQMVSLRGYDCFGNYNTCMVVVEVEDKVAPQCIAPDDYEIMCTDFPDNIDINDSEVMNEYFGEAIAIDDCNAEIQELTPLDYRDECGFGYFVRRFKAVDAYGNCSQICMQTVTVVEFHNYIINFPQDVVADCEFPNDIPEVTFTYIGCEEFAMNIEDQEFPIAEDSACLQIIRKYTIINGCEWDGVSEPEEMSRIDYNGDGLADAHSHYYNGPINHNGYYFYNQIIKIYDNTPPVVSYSGNVEFCAGTDSSHGEGPCEGYVELPVDFEDACTNDVVTSWILFTDTDGDGIFIEAEPHNDVILGEGTGIYSDVLETGNYGIAYYAEDGCGNITEYIIIFDVVDCKPPTVFCDELIAPLMNGTPPLVSVFPEQFLQSGCGGECTSDNCPGEIIVSFSADINDTVKVFNCDDMDSNPIPIEIWVTDAAGNHDVCETFVILQDNSNFCDPGNPMISGYIMNDQGAGIEDVVVSVNDGITPQYSTNAVGYYVMNELTLGHDYTVTPNKDIDYKDGVTAWDMVIIRKHILNIEPFTSPYQMIAADVNNDGILTTADLVKISRLVLCLDSDIENNTSWRFIDASFEFDNPANPFSTGFPESFNVNNILDTLEGVDFVALKVGDVNFTSSTNFNDEIENRGGDFSIYVEDLRLKEGETYEIPFFVKNREPIQAYQFTLNFDIEKLDFKGINTDEESAIVEPDFGLAYLEKGKITTNWYDVNPVVYSSDVAMFSLKFVAKQDADLSSLISVSSDYTKAIAYDNTGESYNVSLEFGDVELSAGSMAFEVMSCKPNPFKEKTIIGFILPVNDIVKVDVYDISGKLIKMFDKECQAGYNEVTVSNDYLSGGGTYFFRLESSAGVQTGKVVLVD